MLARAFSAVVGVMVLHEAEHVVQLWQKEVTGSACPRDCRGLLGTWFDLEWVHFAYNVGIFVALAALYVAGGLWRREWRRRAPVAWGVFTWGLFAVQGYHAVEHTVKLQQWVANGHRAPTPGILGKPLPPASDPHAFSLVELHFGLNTLVLACVLAGYVALGFHGRAWPSRPYAPVAATGLVLAAMGGVFWLTQPPTLRLAAGVHEGPLVIDRTAKVVGEPGAVVRGGIVVTADDVTVRDLTVFGGENGITVDGARDVLLDRVTISGAALDGINARRSTVYVRDCTIRSSGAFAQGIDISYAFDLGPSLVTGCTVKGGQEGIVSHFAHVSFRRNRVSTTTMRAIAVTEMSMGRVERNEIADVTGVGIFCNDYSHCAIANNTIAGMRPDTTSDDASRQGYAIQAHFFGVAHLVGNTVRDGLVGEFGDARIVRD